ncbi:MAG: hypothetical protein ABIS27_13400 [Longimicrobiales bacterium]
MAERAFADRDASYGRVSRVVGGVLREALRTTGATAIVLLDQDSPEGVLVARIAGDAGIPLTDFSDPKTTLTAHPANKTALLTGDFFPRADLLPLGDLYATQVGQLSDEGWSGDPSVHALADTVGGIEQLDGLLQRLLEGREHLDSSDPTFDAQSARIVQTAVAGSRFRRARAGLVPKLGGRSIGVDLLD